MTCDAMPAVAEYRGQKIHRFQSEPRIRGVVMPEIDAALELASDELLAFVGDCSRAPEARLAAARRLLDSAGTAERNRRRSPVNRELVEALTAGLDSLTWVDPTCFNSLLLVAKHGQPQPALRPADDRSALEATCLFATSPSPCC